MRTFGLIGFPLGHSFSRKYFTEKFTREGISDTDYLLFEIPEIEEVGAVVEKHPDLCGFNITIPYKEQIFPFLNELDAAAKAIGAVNVVKIIDGKLKGYNTDFVGFRDSLQDFLGSAKPQKALILGTGGASKAVAYALQSMGIAYLYVSRTAKNGSISYGQLHESPHWIKDHHLIVNTTPLGTYPNTEDHPDIPYEMLGEEHYLYDLVYNPAVTSFMKSGKQNGAKVSNGYDMLIRQAEAAWDIWNS